MNSKLKVAALYSGRSMSQPILLKELKNEVDINLYLFRNSKKEDVKLEFDHELYLNKEDGIRIQGKQPLWVNQFLLRRRWRNYLQKYLDQSFDLVITMNDLGPPAVDVANRYGIPTLFFIRNMASSGQEMYSPDKTHLRNIRSADFGGKIQYPFLVDNFRSYREGLQKATTAIANSEYVARRLQKDFGVDSEVIYPPISLENYAVEYNPDGYIGAVGPRNEAKGADIFFDIVEQMPSEEFISAGVFRDENLEARAKSLDNLHHMGYVENMREFYAKTKLVLVPSRCNEAFGRAAAEPMVSGIPCVVSNRGGLPEVVGDTGSIVSEIESTEAWIEAIQHTLKTHDPQAQKKRSQRFSAEKQGKKLVNIIRDITK